MPGSSASRLRARHAAPQASASALPAGLYQRPIVLQAAACPGQPRPISRSGRAGRPHRPCFAHGGPLEGFRGWVVHVLPPLRPAVLHLPGRQRSDPLTELGQLVGRQHVVHDANARGPHSCGCCAIGERSCGQDRQASGQGSRWLERLARLASPVQPDRHSRRGRAHGKAERVAPCARHIGGAATRQHNARRRDGGVQSAAQTARLTAYQSATVRRTCTRLRLPLPLLSP